MLSANQLFLRTIVDLGNRSISSDPYEILGISGLLRKLLLDDHPLLDQVNREYKHRITFRVIECKSPDLLKAEKTIYYDVIDALDPDAPINSDDVVLHLKKDAFLNKLVAFFNDSPITIRDIIKYEANIGGGVHAPNAPKDETHNNIRDLNRLFVLKGYSVTTYHLRLIAKVVLLALKPLALAINESENE